MSQSATSSNDTGSREGIWKGDVAKEDLGRPAADGGERKVGNGPIEDLPKAFLEIGLGKLVEAFSGDRFGTRKLRDVAKAMNTERKGENWDLLKMSSNSEFEKMSRETIKGLATTVLRFFDLGGKGLWRVIQPSRLRWALAIEKAEWWAVGVKTNVLRSGAFLLEEIPLGDRSSPEGAKALAEGIKAKTQSVAVYPGREKGFRREFILSKTPGPCPESK
jgi:hypothetical protein